ncbi:hypothetical protein JXB41_08160 [Candidatus Woesearchaeota archaeon]|nr:hypothetical protein [Candidatus Woesearchaeota archaeon]
MLNLEQCQKKAVCLIDVDSTIPNLALMKISSFFKKNGFYVDLKKLNYKGYDHSKREITIIDGSQYDKVFISAIFTLNKNTVVVNDCIKVIKGGTGYYGSNPQWLPWEIEHIYPDYTLYKNNNYSLGFLTRGCPNNCKYCFIPKKEGRLKEHSPLDEFYNPNLPKIMLLDNNFLACRNCIKLLKKLKKTGKKITFKQGLDFRLLTKEKAKLLADLDYDGEYIFAFDRMSDKPIIEKKLEIWTPLVKDWKTKFFVLVGFDTSLEQDLDRIYFLKKNKCLPYVMRHSNCYSSENKPFYTDLAAWCNQPGLFKKLNFIEFLKKRHVTRERYNQTVEIIKKHNLIIH